MYLLVLHYFWTCKWSVADGISLNVFSKPSVIVSEIMSINDFPDEILLRILKHFGPEDLLFIIAKVCERWNALAKDVILWKTLSYSCDHSSDISRIVQVRCTALLGFRTN